MLAPTLTIESHFVVGALQAFHETARPVGSSDRLRPSIREYSARAVSLQVGAVGCADDQSAEETERFCITTLAQSAIVLWRNQQ